MKTVSRLSVSFHETFVPERIYLTELLRYANQSEPATSLDISKQTGIPQGKSSGKVSAHLAYARGMGLLNVSTEKSLHRISLTSFGNVILNNDQFIGEQLTQVLLHIHLCRKAGGAEMWYQTFARGLDVLGTRFTRMELESFLESALAKNPGTLGPLLNMYAEENSFARCAALIPNDETLERKSLPFHKDFMRGYVSMFLQMWNVLFHGRQQLTLSEFDESTSFFSILGWSEKQRHEALNEFTFLRAIKIDRMLGAPVITKLLEAESFIDTIYDDLA